MTSNRTALAAGILTILTALLVILGQVALMGIFNYPEIFNQPMADILEQYHRAGGAVTLAWFVFALGTLTMIPTAILLERLVADRASAGLRIGTTFACVAGIAYVIGIMRWVLLARMMSAKLMDPATGAQAREAIVLTFQAFDTYCGNSFGETIAPLCHGAWVLLLGIALLRSTLFPRWLAWVQVLSGPVIAARPLEYVGLGALGEISDIGNGLWCLMLLGMGVALVNKRPRPIDLPNPTTS